MLSAGNKLRYRREKRKLSFYPVRSLRRRIFPVVTESSKEIVNLNVVVKKTDFIIKVFETRSEEISAPNSSVASVEEEERILLSVPSMGCNKQRFSVYLTESVFIKVNRISADIDEPVSRIIRYLLNAWADNPEMFFLIEKKARMHKPIPKNSTAQADAMMQVQVNVLFELGEYKKIKDTTIARNTSVAQMATQLILACYERLI